jgi:hypothetical protein
MVSRFGLSWRPKVLIIFLSLMQEWRGDYGGMVLYLNDQHGILRLQRTTSSVHTGDELRCLGRSPPRAVAHIRGSLLIL